MIWVEHKAGATTTKTIAYGYDPQGRRIKKITTEGTTNQSWSYEAFGNLLEGNAERVTHGYTGERFDPDTGLIYLRARDYDPRTGRFISMDEHPGSQRIPLTLNKYLYTNANPVDHIDPSGYMFISMAMPSFGNIWRVSSVAGRTLGILDNLNIALTKIQMLYSLMNAINQFSSPDWRGAYQGAKGDHGFVSAVADFDMALANLAFNSVKIFMGVEKNSTNPIKQFLGNSKNSLLIYGPTPDPKTPWISSRRISVGKISLSKSHRDVKIEIGRTSGQGGRMLGVGHTQGTGQGHVQWFRQDWHNPHGASDERLVDPPYHYHW